MLIGPILLELSVWKNRNWLHLSVTLHFQSSSKCLKGAQIGYEFHYSVTILLAGEEQGFSLLSAWLYSFLICLTSENIHSMVLIRFVIFSMLWPWWESKWMNRSALWSAHWCLEVRCFLHVSGPFPDTWEAARATVAQVSLPVFLNSTLLLQRMARLVNMYQNSMHKIASFFFR